MTEQDARTLVRHITRAVAAGAVQLISVPVLLSLVVMVPYAYPVDAGREQIDSLDELYYLGPGPGTALLIELLLFPLSALATTITLATPASRTAWAVPLIAILVGIVTIALAPLTYHQPPLVQGG